MNSKFIFIEDCVVNEINDCVLIQKASSSTVIKLNFTSKLIWEFLNETSKNGRRFDQKELYNLIVSKFVISEDERIKLPLLIDEVINSLELFGIIKFLERI